MPDTEKSPAVLSLEAEQRRQQSADAKGDLDSGLEDTFPAFDPVSMISTGVPLGRTNPQEAAKVRTDVDSYTTGPKKAVENDRGTLGSEVRKIIRQRPLAVLGIAATVAFLLGATR